MKRVDVYLIDIFVCYVKLGGIVDTGLAGIGFDATTELLPLLWSTKNDI